jgi:hypothetical protein
MLVMVLCLILPLLIRFASLKWFTNETPQWTEDDLKDFGHFWLVSMNT